jgi:hypothetical protein
MNRLTIRPGLRRLWRDAHRVQFGLNPDHAVIVDLADPAHARLFDLLDGSRNEQRLIRDAAGHGISGPDALELVTAMRDAGLLVPAGSVLPDTLTEPARRRLGTEAAAISASGRPAAEALRRRAAASIAVTGRPRLVVPVATALAASGIGHVDPQVHGRVGPGDVAVGGFCPADIDRPRGVAAAAAVMRTAPEVNTRRIRDGAPSFVVHVGLTAPAELVAHGMARRGLAHLVIEDRDDTILVGPLVIPGNTPCLRCLDLHRHDLDDGWPALAAQVATAPEEIGAAAASTVMIAAGVAAAQVLAFIDGDEIATTGASIEVTPLGPARRRSWERHSRCDCSQSRRRPRTRSRPTGGSG